MPETFHYFPQLPWELRHEIWQLVTRAHWHGAHVFSVYDTKWDKDADRSMDVMFDRSLQWGYGDVRISAPKSLPRPTEASVNYQQREQSPASWTCNNTSMYMLDGGLWTACKESRKVMERTFCEANRCSMKAVATSYFVGQDSTNHYFTVMPHMDLFILQPFYIPNFELEDINKHIPIGSSLAGFQSIKNFALEYDPAWGKGLEDSRTILGYRTVKHLPIFDFLLRAVKECWQADTIWIIDYGLQPSQTDSDGIEYDRSFFYQQDRRYFEATRDDVKYNPLSWQFICEVEYEICSMLEADQESFMDERFAREERARCPSIDLLGCQHF